MYAVLWASQDIIVIYGIPPCTGSRYTRRVVYDHIGEHSYITAVVQLDSGLLILVGFVAAYLDVTGIIINENAGAILPLVNLVRTFVRIDPYAAARCAFDTPNVNPSTRVSVSVMMAVVVMN